MSEPTPLNADHEHRWRGFATHDHTAGLYCSVCHDQWPCEPVRLALSLHAAEQVVEAARRVYRVQANRRLADLDKKQLIRKSESRVSAVTGRLECTWSPRIPSDSGAEQGGLW